MNDYDQHMSEQPQPEDTDRVKSALRTRPATVGDLLKKKPRRTTVTIPSVDDDGKTIELQLLFQAISSRDYDDLISKHRPTSEQKKEGAAYNVDTFAPALISAVAIEPAISLDEAKAIYDSDEWSGGEIGGLFLEALRLCNAGLDVPFTVAG